MDTNILYIYIYDGRVSRLRSKGREENSLITPVSSVGQKIREREKDTVLNRALFADVSLRPTFGSVQFHAWRGGLEDPVPASVRHPATPFVPNQSVDRQSSVSRIRL